MANVIKCPVCGENNLADHEFCQYCQARLQPLTGNLKGTDEPLKPGEFPTKKNTADLEPILPQWLREARSSSRQTSEEEAAQLPQASRPASSRTADLLAGLQSQAQDNDEDDTPDWLANITGETPKTKKPQPESSASSKSPESPEVRWVELGDKKDFAQSESTPDTPPWLAGLNTSTPQPDELTDWFRDANDSQKTQQPLSFDSPAADPQDWLHSMGTGDGAIFNDSGNTDESLISSDTPDWLRAMDAKNETPSTSSASSDTPDWLRAMDEQDKTQSADSAGFSETGSGVPEAGSSSAGDTPDWLKGLESSTSASDQEWLKGFQSDEREQPAQDSAPEDKIEKPEPEQFPVTFEKDDDELDIPGWLKAAAPQSSIFDEPAEQEAPVSVPSSADTSDWLNAFKSVDAPEALAVPAFSTEEPFDSEPPAFVDESKPSADTDALFTEMPDWLSIVDDTASLESIPTPITNVDAIAPGDLPSWVQAMRPVDAGAPQTVSTSLSGDKAVESRGALAGLQGVLPAVAGFSPTSKPKAYSIKLQASEEQQSQAAILDQILAAETAPVPLDSSFVIGTSRVLRWLLVVVLFASLTTVLFMRTQIFALPTFTPLEVGSALQVIQSLPEGAPVLVAFDYEPARSGEIESAAVPMFDQMILLRHPKLTFISTNQTGAILAERFISGPLAGHNYQSGVQYLNLGYLPGGQMGIRAFAENPSVTTPYVFAQSSNLLDFAPIPAWTLPPLEDVTSLSQFAALIVITDNADDARAWVEQTTSARGVIPFVVVSSAQSAPMIQPYYASQQITGLVSGLYGGALFEQNNAGRPGTARAYWDAYSIGTLLAMLLILGGGLLNLALGLRDRAAAREAK